MKESLASLGRDFMTARAFIYTLRHSSPSEQATKDFWSKASPEAIDKIVKNLSDPNDKEREQIRRILSELGVCSVLDAGCGPATEYLSYRSSDALREVKYVGVDLSARMLDIARARFDGIPLVRSDADSLPFADKSFDAVVIRHVLEHQPNGYKKIVEEAIRIARKGVVIDFFLPPLGFNFDVKLTGKEGIATNWYSKNNFEKFLFSFPFFCVDLVRCPNIFGQNAAIYTLVK